METISKRITFKIINYLLFIIIYYYLLLFIIIYYYLLLFIIIYYYLLIFF